ncbi:MAG: O-antigen ligase family protein [Cellvibrionaceae bacterium]|nr:O-antigen ligase family protein [Cellvibrionaceae bacterium]
MMVLSTERRNFSNWLVLGYPYLVLCFLPIALLDLRINPIIVKIRISDLYLATLICLFPLLNPRATSWAIKCFLPFLPFLAYLLFSAIFTDNTTGIYEFIQWVIVLFWIPLFASVFSTLNSSQLRYFVLSMALAAFYVVAIHAYEGIYIRYKFMGDAKYIFGITFLVVSLWMFQRFSWRALIVFIASATFLVLSLERKGILASVLTIVTIVPLLRLQVSGFFQSLTLIAIQVLCLISGFVVYLVSIKGEVSVTHYLDEARASWESNLHRSNLLANGIEIFQSNLWFGVGAKKLDDHMQTFYLADGLAHYTHNWYLDFFIEYGIVGVVLFFMPVLVLILKIQPKHQRAWLFVPLAVYCLFVPTMMANGTTTMLIYLTAIASICVLGLSRRDILVRSS